MRHAHRIHRDDLLNADLVPNRDVALIRDLR